MARTHVTISDELLEAIDGAVGKAARVRFLEEAAFEKLERLGLEEAISATAGIASGGAYAHWVDREASAAWVRSTRRTP